MTRQEIESRINENIKYIANCEATIRELEEDNSELEQELKKLDVKVYEPQYIPPFIFTHPVEVIRHREQHNAMEEYKHKLSKLNNGWFPDWKDEKPKARLFYDTQEKLIDYTCDHYFRQSNDYEYFNPEIAYQVIKELGELWKKGKDIK